MEFIEKVGDFFTSATSKIERGITSIFGSSNENRIKKIGFVRNKQGDTVITPGSLLDHINGLEETWKAKSDAELKQTADILRARLKAGETLDDLLPDAFAAVRESGRRFLQMRHYDVQMVGGWILHNGMIAEMVTGEGKTLVATLPTFLNAIAGKVHVITVNDYLALRDMEWMGPIHINLGLTIGAIQSNMGPSERQKHYACDVTYGTSNQFGFDYLRDNMKPTRELQVQGPLHYAVVDEIDNILIDEARTPLIISGPAHDNLDKYPKANTIAKQLRADTDFEVKEKEHTCHLTEEGTRRAEELAGVDSFYTAGNMEWPHLIDNALKAHHLYKKDINYVVDRGEIVIVDENTGRKMEGRQWSDGLHQAVEAKEGVKIKEESQTLATITLQNYFKLYDKLSGMTGTAMTEAEEFWKIYKLDVMAVPTNRYMQRINHPDNIYGTDKEKWNAVVDEIQDVNKSGRPILVGTTSIETSELVSRKLVKRGIKHDVLNAKQHEREAEIVAQAGRRNAVTIATNMAGRGTDIVLGGNLEAELKNLAGDVTGFARVWTADGIRKISYLSINIMPGARYFNLVVNPDDHIDAPRFAHEGMISVQHSQLSMDMYHDKDMQALIRSLVQQLEPLTEIYKEAKESGINFVPSRQVHMRAFCSPHFLNVFNPEAQQIPQVLQYAERYFAEWKKLFAAAGRLDETATAERTQRRTHMSDMVVELDPDRQMVVQVYGEQVVRDIEAAVMY